MILDFLEFLTVKMPVPIALKLANPITEQAAKKKGLFASEFNTFVKSI
jgi:hypothetical protein